MNAFNRPLAASAALQNFDSSLHAAPSNRRQWLAAATGAVLATQISTAFAQQNFPTKTVRIIVPYAPGGGLDVMARLLADQLQRKWKQAVIVENKTGASTIIGTMAVAKAPADGHTLLLTSEATITSNPYLFDKLPYDPARDLAPISQILSLPQMVVAHPSITANTLSELVAQAKSGKQAINYASYGSGSLPHLLFGGLKLRTGIDLVQVPYKGITPAVMAALGNEVQLTLAGVSGAQAYLTSGKLKALAVANDKRLPEFPKVPTLQEEGFGDINPHASWFGLFSAAGTPPAVCAQIQQDVAAIGHSPEFAQHLAPRGFTPVFSTPAAFTQFIAEDAAQKAKLIRMIGAKAE